MSDQRRGLVFGMVAFALWGLFPLYWRLLEPANAEEILAHRILWSLVVLAIMLVVTGRTAAFRAILTTPRTRLLMAGASVLIAVNWFTYIWGVNHGYVVETSLGYYVNPLVTVMLGVVVLGESLRTVQWLALGTGLVAVVVLSVELGRPPYIALVLAVSFGTYGLVKKQARVGPTEGVAFEAALLTPLAGGYLAWTTVAGTSESWSHGPWHVLLLSATGIVTVVPLLLFAGAANRVSLTTIGLLQYIAPTMQFLLGVTVFHEAMPLARWAGFLLVWVALLILTAESVVVMRRHTATPAGQPVSAAPVAR